MIKTIFENRCNLIKATLAILFGIIASSCAPEINISELTADAQNTVRMMDESERRFQAEDISEGVISDYIALIDFLIARNELRAKSLAPATPVFTDNGTTYPRVIFFYQGVYEIDKDRREFFLKECQNKENERRTRCINSILDRPVSAPQGHKCKIECAKILLENHAKSVLKVEISPDSLEVIPSSIREFRKTEDCSRALKNPVAPASRHELAALGLCIEVKTPENGLELLEKEGLHVYGANDHLISPFAPEEFWVNTTDRRPFGHYMTENQRRSTVYVMKDLKHVTAQRTDSRHKAIGIRSGKRPIEYSMLYDHTCIKIKPRLPEQVVNKLVMARAGENSLNPSSWEGDKFYVDDGDICQGQDPYYDKNTNDLFSDKKSAVIDLASLFSPQEIENKLKATLQTAKAKGDIADEWRALNTTLYRLEKHHPKYDTEIARRIIPIFIEAVRHDLRTSNHGYYHKTLARMPHKSLEPYLDDLIWIIEDNLAKLGCEGLRCPQNLRSLKLHDLARILNGAGPKAEDYLEQIEQANKDMIAKFGPGIATQIGGTQNAKLCIHDKPDCVR